MSPKIVKLKPFVAERNAIFCKPLNFHFPQIFRLHRSRRIPPGQTPAAPGNWSLRSHAKFSLSGEVAPLAEIVCAEPIGHLAPSDQKSLVLRHHWSRALAQAYLQGVEDIEPDQPIGGVFDFNDALFTLTQRATSKAWNGPMIFYLADLFEDDGLMSAQSWEMSASCDGIVCRSDIFYGSE
jgi:hypothetical protein